ncbi:hypothetical protein VTH06DRAFT_8773 [Thermothelomyces fergusii]
MHIHRSGAAPPPRSRSDTWLFGDAPDDRVVHIDHNNSGRSSYSGPADLWYPDLTYNTRPRISTTTTTKSKTKTKTTTKSTTTTTTTTRTTASDAAAYDSDRRRRADHEALRAQTRMERPFSPAHGQSRAGAARGERAGGRSTGQFEAETTARARRRGRAVEGPVLGDAAALYHHHGLGALPVAPRVGETKRARAGDGWLHDGRFGIGAPSSPEACDLGDDELAGSAPEEEPPTWQQHSPSGKNTSSFSEWESAGGGTETFAGRGSRVEGACSRYRETTTERWETVVVRRDDHRHETYRRFCEVSKATRRFL